MQRKSEPSVSHKSMRAQWDSVINTCDVAYITGDSFLKIGVDNLPLLSNMAYILTESDSRCKLHYCDRRLRGEHRCIDLITGADKDDVEKIAGFKDIVKLQLNDVKTLSSHESQQVSDHLGHSRSATTKLKDDELLKLLKEWNTFELELKKLDNMNDTPARQFLIRITNFFNGERPSIFRYRGILEFNAKKGCRDDEFLKQINSVVEQHNCEVKANREKAQKERRGPKTFEAPQPLQESALSSDESGVREPHPQESEGDPISQFCNDMQDKVISALEEERIRLDGIEQKAAQKLAEENEKRKKAGKKPKEREPDARIKALGDSIGDIQKKINDMRKRSSEGMNSDKAKKVTETCRQDILKIVDDNLVKNKAMHKHRIWGTKFVRVIYNIAHAITVSGPIADKFFNTITKSTLSGFKSFGFYSLKTRSQEKIAVVSDYLRRPTQ